jgi:enamine deaminase RidA (YjgF/YER057c/UK114 family)
MTPFSRVPVATKVIIAGAFLAGILAGALGAMAKTKLAKEFLNTGAKPSGFTQVVTAAPGKIVFVSGASGPGTDFETQARNTFESLKGRLALAGATFQDVVKINYYLADISHTAELRKVRAQYLDTDHPPAATLVQAALGSKTTMLEVEAIAMVPAR